MTKLIMALLGITVFAFFLFQENSKNHNKAFAQTGTRDAAVVMCVAEAAVSTQTNSRRIIVAASSSGRVISRGTDCSNALADLLRAGYILEDVQAVFNTTGVFYTLSKP